MRRRPPSALVASELKASVAGIVAAISLALPACSGVVDSPGTCAPRPVVFHDGGSPYYCICPPCGGGCTCGCETPCHPCPEAGSCP
ncbi:MAG TPA: hypothetical protein VMB50_02960 [Myxococcales bacterium]|nr:hypothetical protein [Myxococcales bacterium]